MRRFVSVLAAPAALVLLAGCGLSLRGEDPSPAAEPSPSATQASKASASEGSPAEGASASGVASASEETSTGGDGAGSGASSSTAASPDGDGSEPSSSATEAPRSDADATASPASSAPPGDASADGGPTEVVSVWVDSSWNVEESEEDFCSFGGASPSQFSDDGYLFTCGPTAVSALACDLEDDGTVLCITNAAEKQALRFPSPSLVAEGPPEPDGGSATVPLHVTLSDGNRCYVLAHDQSEHWGGKFSWYGCDDGSELLTDEDLDGTFDRDGGTWTVQRSTDGGEPVETPLEEVVFAGK